MRWVGQLSTGTDTASCRDTKDTSRYTRKHYNVKPAGLSKKAFRFSHSKIPNEQGETNRVGVFLCWGKRLSQVLSPVSRCKLSIGLRGREVKEKRCSRKLLRCYIAIIHPK